MYKHLRVQNLINIDNIIGFKWHNVTSDIKKK